MGRMTTFEVIGLPRSQGSKQAFVRGGRGVVVEAGSKASRDAHSLWRTQVADGARKALEGSESPFSGPTEVTLVFYLPLPASDKHRTLHTHAPDIDKISRSCLDSLVNGGLLADDSLVWLLSAKKGYARDGHWTGVSITLSDSSAEEQTMREVSKTMAKLARKR